MSERAAVRARAMILATPWAMTPEMVQTMLAIAERENLSPEAVAAQLGRPLDNARDVTVRDGVAIIPVEGPIARHMDLFTEISGGVSIETLATDLRAALDSPGVHSIVLAIDSPGGEVGGTGEFAAMVRAADAQKPVVAYIGGLGASAAYWIASAAGEVVADGSALVGSIGVVMAVPDPEKRQSRSIEFVSSQSPHKRPDPRTEGGKGRLQSLVDDSADVFIAAVAEYRGMTAEAVAALGGGLLVGQKAVDAGLADRVGSFEGVVADLQQRAREPRRVGNGGRMAAQSTEGNVAEQGFWSKFFGGLGAQMDATPAFVERAATGGSVPTTLTVPMVPPGARYQGLDEVMVGPDQVATIEARQDPEIESLRAELARMKAAEAERARAGLAANAAAFAEAEIRAGRALPAEQEALVAAYTEAAEDDAAHPRAEGQPSRVARLAERQAARPAHGLTAELVPVQAGADGGTLTILDSARRTRQEGEAAPLTADRWREQRAFTSSGRAFLAQHGIPATGPLSAEHRATIARLAEAQGLTLAG